MHEFFLPLPLDAPPAYKRVRGVSIKRTKFTTSGKFVAVKDYTYIKVAKRIGELQAGINLFYLVDNGVIIGYRKNDHYFLREGSMRRRRVLNGKRSNK
jgi:hypothetical protein